MKNTVLFSTLLSAAPFAVSGQAAPAVVHITMHITSQHVEKLSGMVLLPMENEMKNLPDIKNINSSASSGGDMKIVVEFSQAATSRELELVKKVANDQAGQLVLKLEKLDVALGPRPDF